jgi:hypothetical protein
MRHLFIANHIFCPSESEPFLNILLADDRHDFHGFPRQSIINAVYAAHAVLALEATVKELTRQNEKLESDLAAQLEVSSELQAGLEEQKTNAASILLERALIILLMG